MAWVLPVLISIPEHSNPHGNEAHDKIHNTQWGFVSFSFTICAYLQREYLLIHTLLWIEKWWNSIKQHHLICKHVHIFKREVVKADHELSQSSEWVSTHTNNWTGVWLGATAKYISTHCIQLISLVLCALHSSVSFYLCSSSLKCYNIRSIYVKNATVMLCFPLLTSTHALKVLRRVMGSPWLLCRGWRAVAQSGLCCELRRNGDWTLRAAATVKTGSTKLNTEPSTSIFPETKQTRTRLKTNRWMNMGAPSCTRTILCTGPDPHRRSLCFF